VRIEAYGLLGYGHATEVFVPARHGDALVIAVVDRSALGPGDPVSGMDPQLGLVRLETTAPAIDVLDGPAAEEAWAAALAAGRLALAHELVGLTRAALELVVAHAGSRRQFGRPVGGYQAVKHRLADVKVALVTAEEAAAEAGATGGPVEALLAKIWAGRAARTAGRHVQQVLGGMGFTWEHAFHRYLRRMLADDALLGSHRELTAEVGRMIVDQGRTPELASL
ncbi:MAG TPA: acyl-CoA dehydrogenase family protein, partial [Pseudonocardia sp.]